MQFYILNGSQQEGPLSADQVNDLLARGSINQSTLIWFEGLSEWAPIEKFTHLFPVNSCAFSNQTGVCKTQSNTSKSIPISSERNAVKSDTITRSYHEVFKNQLVPFRSSSSEKGKVWETKGRIGRRQFFSRIMAIHITGLVVAIICSVVITAFSKNDQTGLLQMLVGLEIALTTFAALPHTVKRLHDIGVGGEYALFGFLPVINIFIFITLCIWPEATGPNKYD